MNEDAVLMQLVAAVENAEPDWPDALRRAGFAGRHLARGPQRRRRLIAAVAVATVLLYAVSAIAADNQAGVIYWLFDRSGETYPTTQTPVVGEWKHEKRAGLVLVRTAHGLEPEVRWVNVLHGQVAGHEWNMQAFFGDERGANKFYYGFDPRSKPKPFHGTNVASFYSVGWSPGVYGVAAPSPDRELHWVSATVLVPGPIEPSGGGTGPKYLYGAASPKVAEVDLENNDGTVVRVPTFAAPEDLPVRIRFWVAVLRLDHLVHTVVPRDAAGHALEHWKLPVAE